MFIIQAKFCIARPNEIHIIDLGSSSGTIVNGEKVNKCLIKDGDELALGDTRIQVSIAEAVATGEVSQSAPAPAAVPQAPPPMAPKMPPLSETIPRT